MPITVVGAVGRLAAAGSGWFAYTGKWDSANKAATCVLTQNDYTMTAASTLKGGARGTLPITQKTFWGGQLIQNPGSTPVIGICDSTEALTKYTGETTHSWGWYGNNGKKITNAVETAYGSTFTLNEITHVAFDPAAGSLWFAKNGVWQASGNPLTGANPAFTGITGTIYPYNSDVGSATQSVHNMIAALAGF